MKKQITFFLLLTVISFGAFSQRGNQDPQEKAKSMTAQMVEKLSLDQNQEAKVYEINLKYVEKSQANRSGSRGSKSSEATDQLSKEKDAELKAFLNDQQYGQWLKLKSELNAGKTGSGRRGPG